MSTESVSVSYVGGHRVLAEMLISSVERHGVLIILLLTVSELTAACVGRHGLVSAALSGDVSVPYVGGHGVLAETLVSSVNGHGVVSVLLTELLPAGVDEHGVVTASSLSVKVMCVPDVDGHGVLAETLVSSVNGHGVLSVLPTDTELLPAGVDEHGVVTASSLSVKVTCVPDVDGHGVLSELLLSWVD